MTKIRAEKINRVQNYIPELRTEFCEEGDLLVIGWGGTYGSLYTAVKQLQGEDFSIGLAHFNYINPLPRNTEAVLKRFKKLVVCELNKGQLALVLRMHFNGCDFLQYNKIQGLPFGNDELIQKFTQLVQ